MDMNELPQPKPGTAASDEGMNLLRAHLDNCQKMYDAYGMGEGDYAKLQEESPKIMQTIREIEDKITGDYPIADLKVAIERMEKNWAAAFSRRRDFKRKQAGRPVNAAQHLIDAAAAKARASS